MEKREWYSVKCIFEHDGYSRTEGTTVYEERIVVVRAVSLNDAIEQGEAEAKEYVEDFGDDSVHYPGFISAYHTYEKVLKANSEVYSLMRESPLDRQAFLDHYHDDGTQRAQTFLEPK